MFIAEEMREANPVKTKRVARKQAYVERILKSSQSIFAKKGFQATTVDEIASRAGITKRTLYSYFPSKTALYTRMYEDYQKELYSELKKVIKMNLQSDELIFKYYEVLFRFTQKHKEFSRNFMWILGIHEFIGDIPDKVRKKIYRNGNEMIALVTDSLTRALNDGRTTDVDPLLLLHTILAINKGIFTHTSRKRHRINPENLYELSKIILKRGIMRSSTDLPKPEAEHKMSSKRP